jgi:O-antigen biosynthesis protein WbqP|tara:strand:- start:816 stop:1376 length:561 start_codon:yes stop_codon:yes gene_type:complete
MIQKIIAFILAVVLSPIIAIIIIIILIDDGFPIIYVQKNYGLNHKPFDLYKFRTMKNDTPEVPTEHFTENHSASFLLKSGRLLRKYSLDELPQLVNIIKGEMNFIGPRPCMVNNEEVVKDLREEYGIDKLVPGITGWAQVNGRDLNSFEKKVSLDLYYLQNKSMLLNIKIVIKTFIVILLRKDIKH